MAVKVMSLVWERFPGNDEEKIVFLAIADACGDDGAFISDGVPIAKKCSLGLADTQVIIASLVAESWLICEGELPGGLKQYRVALDRLYGRMK